MKSDKTRLEKPKLTLHCIIHLKLFHEFTLQIRIIEKSGEVLY